jgi:hypothetical protein
MPRFISWLFIGVAAAFLVVATASSLSATTWLAFAVASGTLVVSMGVSYAYRRNIATLATGVVAVVVSAWTVVASLIFSQPTADNLALASGLALAALAIAGLTEQELANERAVGNRASHSDPESRLSAAA